MNVSGTNTFIGKRVHHQNKMKYIILLISLFLFPPLITKAIPAYPYPIRLAIGDNDTVSVIMQGDELRKYAITCDTRHSVMCDSDGQWRYLEKNDDGQIVLSGFTLTSKPDKTTADFLKHAPTLLVPKSAARTLPDIATINRTSPVAGTRKALIILAEFSDLKFRHDNSDFDRLFNEYGYTLHGATGSVADYFTEVSEDQLNLEATVIGPFKTSRPMSFYGKNSAVNSVDSNPWMLFSEALDYAAKNVDLCDYDCDNDGFIDNIHIIYAGYGEEAGASSDAIWAHESTFSPQYISPGLYIDRYSCSPELRGNQGSIITTIGPPCHEICHALGAMDFYDTDYAANGQFDGTGNWDVMGSGSWNNEGRTPAWPNPYIRAYNFQWTVPTPLEENGEYIIDGDSPRKIYRINTPEDNDFYLIDFHSQESFMSAEPSKGLLIYHVGPDIDTRAETNSINSSYPQQCYPVCASSSYPYPVKGQYSYGSINSSGCPFPGSTGNTLFDGNSTPAAMTISGKDAGFGISDITWDSQNSISFTYNRGQLSFSGLGWKESFENESDFKNWTTEPISGQLSWERENHFNGIPDGKSVAVISSVEGAVTSSEAIIKITSPSFQLTNGNHDESIADSSLSKWKFSYWSKSDGTPSGLEVSITDGNECIHKNIQNIPDIQEWNEYSFEFAASALYDKTLQICLVAKLETINGGSLRIDNLSLSPILQAGESYIDTILSPDVQKWRIHTITGQYIGSVYLPTSSSPTSLTISDLTVKSGIYIGVCGSTAVKLVQP